MLGDQEADWTCIGTEYLRDLSNRLGLGNGQKREPLLLTSRKVQQGHVFGRIYTRSPWPDRAGNCMEIVF